MATLILTTIGTAVAGPIGGILGGLVGGALDRSFSGSGNDRVVEGARLKNLNVQTSSYGEPLPLIYGRMRASGNVIWSAGIKEKRTSSSKTVGSGKQSSKVTNVSYTYSASFAVALSSRPIWGIGKIWADGKLLREADSSLAVSGNLKIYRGEKSQKKDPLIESIAGSENTNNFRNIAYVLFEDLALGEYANRIPNLTFEVIGDEGGKISLQKMVVDLCEKTNLKSVNAEDLDQMVEGYVISGTVKTRSVLEDLASAYHFDIIGEGDSVLFKKLQRNTSLSISKDELISKPSSQPDITVTRAQDLELPKEISLSYIDPERDYQMGLQRAKRLKSGGLQVIQRRMPLVLEASAAKNISEAHLDRAWKERDHVGFALPYKYSDLAPGDVVELPFKTGAKKIMIKNIELSDQGLECEGLSYGASFEVRNLPADSGGIPRQKVEKLASSGAILMDMPLINAEDVRVPLLFWGAYAGVGRWTGSALMISHDDGASFEVLSSASEKMVTGDMQNILGEGNSVTWDNSNEIKVLLQNTDMQLENATELEVLNGSNIAWIGGEIIQFQKAVKQEDGSYVLSKLLRGRRGTEYLISGHRAEENFVLVSSLLPSASLLLSDVGGAAQYKTVTLGADEDEGVPFTFHYQANSLKPFSPASGVIKKTASGDIEISWIRRSRVGAQWLDAMDVPLGELYEKYEIDIIKNGKAVRTVTVNQSHFTYKTADQITDFGSAKNTVTLHIYQLSDYVGRGHSLII